MGDTKIGDTEHGALVRAAIEVVALPLPSLFSYLADLAGRAVDADAEPRNTLAGRAAGDDAFFQYQFALGQVVGSLREMAPAERVVFGLVVLDYIDRHPDDLGLEAVLAAVTNGVWHAVSDATAAHFAQRMNRTVATSRFVERYGLFMYDPLSHTISHAEQWQVTAIDLNVSLEDDWRKRLRAAAEQHRVAPIPAVGVDDIRRVIAEIGTFRPDGSPIGEDDHDGFGPTAGWSELRDRVLDRFGDLVGGAHLGEPGVDDYHEWARKDVGGGGLELPSMPAGVQQASAAQRADNFVNNPTGRSPVTRADLDDRAQLAGGWEKISEGKQDQAKGSVLTAIGITVMAGGFGIATAAAAPVVVSALVIVTGVDLALGGLIFTNKGIAKQVRGERESEEGKNPRPPDKKRPNPTDETPTIMTIDKKAVNETLRRLAKTKPGWWSPVSDQKDQWRNVRDPLEFGGGYLEIIDPLDDPERFDMMFADERGNVNRLGEEARHKVAALVLERKVYKLASGIGLPVTPISTPVGIVLP